MQRKVEFNFNRKRIVANWLTENQRRLRDLTIEAIQKELEPLLDGFTPNNVNLRHTANELDIPWVVKRSPVKHRNKPALQAQIEALEARLTKLEESLGILEEVDVPDVVVQMVEKK